MDAISTDTDSTATVGSDKHRLRGYLGDKIRETTSTKRSPVPVTDLSTSKIEIRLEVIRETTFSVPVTDLSTSECSPVTDLSTRESTVRSSSTFSHSPLRLEERFRIRENPTFRLTDSPTSSGSPYLARNPPAQPSLYRD